MFERNRAGFQRRQGASFFSTRLPIRIATANNESRRWFNGDKSEAWTMVKKTTLPVTYHEAGHAVFNWRDFDPATLNGKSDFVAELTSYRDNLDTLLQDRGKYVVIKGPEIVGVFRTQSLAMKAAFRFAPGPVLVKKIGDGPGPRDRP
jgi:hypothetical protein